MINQIKTISIGIPVHNEAETIENLIYSIIRQKRTEFELENIFVICDGTNDGTDKIIENLGQTSPNIRMINDGERKGKVERIKEIFKLNTSDIIMVLDGDVVLGNEEVLNEVAKSFEMKETALVSANNQPVKANTLIGNIINYDVYIWYQVRLRYNDGDNIYNIRGCCIALSKEFAKKANFPTQIHSYGRYLYLLGQQKKMKFVFAKNAIIWYRKPNNIRDYLLQSRRSTPDRSKLKTMFGPLGEEKFKIPFKYKLSAVLDTFFENPFLFISSVVLKILVKKIPLLKQNSKNTVIWGMIKSTKTPIPVTF